MKRSELVKLKPPLILLVLLAGATALHLLTPLGGLVQFRLLIPGTFSFILGLGMMIAAQRLFRKVGTTIIPSEKPTHFVVAGPFKFTRNPMYVAGALMTLGIALWVGTLPFLIAWITMFFVLNFIHIPYEEENLTRRFGQEYLDYKKRVRRWL